MEKKDCFYLGKIVKLFSFKGAIVAYFDVDAPSEYAKLKEMYVEVGERLVLYSISEIRVNNHKAVLTLANTTAEDSERLVGKELYLPLTMLPALEGKKFYYHEVVGFEVEDEAFGAIGTITEIIDNSPQALFSIDHTGKEVLIPIIDDFIIKIDRQEKKIRVHCPEGLIELYLE
jgi:16S rRNA processing protein RimM